MNETLFWCYKYLPHTRIIVGIKIILQEVLNNKHNKLVGVDSDLRNTLGDFDDGLIIWGLNLLTDTSLVDS